MSEGNPVNILLVDDQPAKLLSYEVILANLGENLIRANSGKEALEYLLKNDIAVVLVDVCMPELDGFELAAMIRNHPRFQKTAIILVSGVLVEDSHRLKGYGSGAVDYISVPIIPEILRAKVAVFAELYRKNEELVQLNRGLEERVRERTAEIENLLASAEEARREAEAANRIKDEFLATLSHELRTPLNAIAGWAHMLRAGKLDEPTQAKAVEIISRNAAVQNQLISDLLDVSRIITGKMRLDLEDVRLHPIVDAALDTVRPAAEAKGIHVSVELASEDEEIVGDPARLQQVIWNLLSNAIKFAPKDGHVLVRLETVGSHAEITVRDDGPGIPPEVLPYIFERFRQADSSSTRSHRGLGLGLAIVRHLMEMHGGSVEAVNGTDGTGAIFTVFLPRRLPAVAGVVAIEAGGELSEPSVTDAHVWLAAAPSLKGVRVLVVDDEPEAREVVAAILERCGAEPRVAASAAEALALLERERPDVLVADIEMPGEDGYGLVRKLRALPAERGGQTPAIALTAYARAQDRVQALGAGFQVHMAKPVQPAELAASVARLAPDVVSVAPIGVGPAAGDAPAIVPDHAPAGDQT